MSESQSNEGQPSDFARALISTMDNLENVVGNFEKTLLVMSQSMEKLEPLEKPSRDGTTPKKGPNTEEIKQLTNDAPASAEMPPHQELSETQNETKMAPNTKVICVLGMALVIVSVIIVKLYFMLFG